MKILCGMLKVLLILVIFATSILLWHSNYAMAENSKNKYTWEYVPHYRHASQYFGTLLLDDDWIMFTGGTGEYSSLESLKTTMYHYPTKTVKVLADIPGHSSGGLTRLQDGRVFRAQGMGHAPDSEEGYSYNYRDRGYSIYDFNTNTWTVNRIGSNFASRPGAVLLNNGNVLKFGQLEYTSRFKVEVYDISLGTIVNQYTIIEDEIGYGMNNATKLKSGEIILIGKKTLRISPDGSSYTFGTPHPNGFYHPSYSAQSLLKDGRILVSGLNSLSFYDPRNDTWEVEQLPFQQIHSHSQVTLSNGDVLLIGGYIVRNNYGSNASAILKFDQIQPMHTIKVISPTADQVIGGSQTAFIPTVRAEAPDGEKLTLSMYVDSESTPRQTKTITNTSGYQLVNFDAVNMSGFSEGNHTFRFTADDGMATVQEIVNFRVDKTPPVFGTVTMQSTASNSITISGSASDALAGMDAAPYRYTVAGNAGAWTDQTSHTRSSLTPNTSYIVRFEARDKAGMIASKQQTVYTLAQVPTFTIGNQQNGLLELTFSDSNPAVTQYQIKVGSQYVNSSGNLTSSPSWVTTSGRKITVRGLNAGTTYSIQAKARNQANVETAFSTAVNGTTLANPPASLSLDLRQTSIAVSWPAVTGATGYDIEADGVVINNGTSRTYVHNNLTPDTSHQYRVRVKNAGGVGNWSNLQTAMTLPYPPAIPGNLTAVPSQRFIDLQWDAVVKADSYEVEENGTNVYKGPLTALTHRQLEPKTDYSYRVRAVNRGGAGEWSPSYQVMTLPDPPLAPVSLVPQITKNSVNVKWLPVEEATGYEIEVDGLIIDNGDQTEYEHLELLPLTGHTYRVRATNIGGKSPWGEQLDVTTYPEEPVVPTNVMGTSDGDSITITWYQVSYAESYEVEIDGSVIINLSDTVFTHDGLEQDAAHSYRVRARNVSGVSPWSNVIPMSTMPEDAVALTNLVAVVTNNSITLSWDAIPFDGRFEVEVDGVLMDNGKDTIYHHTGLTAEEYHTYKIRVVEDQTGVQQWYAILSLATLPNAPDAPGEIEAFATNTTIELRWQRVDSATGYDVEVNGTVVDNGMLEIYLHQQLTPGTTYYYRVRAKNITGVTAWSPLLSQSTTSPTYIVDAVYGQNFELSLLTYHVQDFSQMTFVVTYDPERLEVADLYGFTPAMDQLLVGELPGTHIDVVHVPGRIEYRVKQSIVPGNSWTGELASIIFTPVVSGETSIDFIVE